MNFFLSIGLLILTLTIRIHISGTLRDHRMETISGATILLKTDDQIIDSCTTDTTGAYSLSFLDVYDKGKEFLFYVVQEPDTFLIYKTDRFETESPVIDLKLPDP